jgi:hypothetical protein
VTVRWVVIDDRQTLRAPPDTADGHRGLRGERGEHLPLRDDGQVGGAPARRRVPAARRGGHGEERGGVGAADQAPQRGLLPQVGHRHRHDVVPRPAVPGHGVRTQEEGRLPRRVDGAVRAR